MKWSWARPIYSAFRFKIREERDEYVKEARASYAFRSQRKENKRRALEELVSSAAKMRVNGETSERLAQLYGRSPRTIYRCVRTVKIEKWSNLNNTIGNPIG
jgi:hypothetical protein